QPKPIPKSCPTIFKEKLMISTTYQFMTVFSGYFEAWFDSSIKDIRYAGTFKTHRFFIQYAQVHFGNTFSQVRILPFSVKVLYWHLGSNLKFTLISYRWFIKYDKAIA